MQYIRLFRMIHNINSDYFPKYEYYQRTKQRLFSVR